MGIRREIKAGDFVTSTSGRDKNRYYVVMTAGDKNVEICDGDLHKLNKQKKKNIKHIKYAGDGEKTLTKKIECGETMTDSEIRRILKTFRES
ncbi:MAG: RNA-binding protein [Ruminococcaceae bacterium]|nr:RNA-binding protein [Oscillospiraceae bacterium]